MICKIFPILLVALTLCTQLTPSHHCLGCCNLHTGHALGPYPYLTCELSNHPELKRWQTLLPVDKLTEQLVAYNAFTGNGRCCTKNKRYEEQSDHGEDVFHNAIFSQGWQLASCALLFRTLTRLLARSLLSPRARAVLPGRSLQLNRST